MNFFIKLELSWFSEGIPVNAVRGDIAFEEVIILDGMVPNST